MAIPFPEPTTVEKIHCALEHLNDELDDDWQVQSTQILDLVYADDAGNTVIYYLCRTTYYDTAPTEVTGLDINAIRGVIAPESAESTRQCQVNDAPAALFHLDGRSYLCWTLAPEISCILEYDPLAISEEDIFRMARSTPYSPSSG